MKNSWASNKSLEARWKLLSGEGYGKGYQYVNEMLDEVIRGTIEEAARRCEIRYLHGEAGIAARDCADFVRRMLTDESGEETL